MPFTNRRFTLTQPDGSQFEALGTGNQHQATFTTPDGYVVVQDPVSGFFQYAEDVADGQPLPSGVQAESVDPSRLGMTARAASPTEQGDVRRFVSAGLPRSRSRWQVRRERTLTRGLAALANGEISLAPPQRQTVGQFTGLCLLVQFPDMAGTVSRDEVERFCNQPGYAGFGNNGSVRDYFFDVSDGRLTYTNIVAPWYTAKKPRRHYTDEGVTYPRRARELIVEALKFHKEQGFDFSGLTVDGDGFVYALNIFYAGRATNNWSKGLWPHAHHLQSPLKLASGRRANDYQITDLPDELSLGTFCHENGHMVCDFPDLYDYGGQSSGVGNYCLMCGGANADPKNPTQIGAYLKHAAGWASNVAALAPGRSLSLAVGRNEFALLKRNRTEYFLIEARAQAGRDASLPDAGLAVWKIDETGDNENEAMTASAHYECALLQADGANELELGVNNGNAGDLYAPGRTLSATSRPNSNWWNGSASGLAINTITTSGTAIGFST